MSNDALWTDLIHKGFVVVPGFLAASEIGVLIEGFDRGRPPQDYPFGFKLIGRAPLKAAWSRIEPALAAIRSQTEIKVDVINFLTLSHYITTRFAERTSFLHQDFDLDYQLTRDHLNYLNFWMPLRKPERARSNVTLVPFDALREIAPEEHQRFVGSGGNRFVVENGRTRVFANYGGILPADGSIEPERFLDFDIEGIALTPPLDAGDLLLMRGDVIHRTQDTDTERVAASVRVTYSGKIITRERAGIGQDSGGSKEDANIGPLLRKCFSTLGRPEVTVAEFVEFSRGRGAA